MRLVLYYTKEFWNLRNFKHIVNVYRIRGYNSINLRLGYPSLNIHSPKEIVGYED